MNTISPNHFPRPVWLLASVYGFVVSSQAFCGDRDSRTLKYTRAGAGAGYTLSAKLTNDGAERLLSYSQR